VDCRERVMQALVIGDEPSLVRSGLSTEISQLHIAAKSGQHSVVKALLNGGVNPDAPNVVRNVPRGVVLMSRERAPPSSRSISFLFFLVQSRKSTAVVHVFLNEP